jgi:hypothetical protein
MKGEQFRRTRMSVKSESPQTVGELCEGTIIAQIVFRVKKNRSVCQ